MQTNKFDLNAISGVQDLSDTAAEKYCGGNGSDREISPARARFLARRALVNDYINALRTLADRGERISPDLRPASTRFDSNTSQAEREAFDAQLRAVIDLAA